MDLYHLFRSIPQEDLIAILREAGIRDDRPEVLRGQGGSVQPGEDWARQHVHQLLPLLFRYIDPPDTVVATLVAAGYLRLPDGVKDTEEIILSGFETYDRSDRPTRGAIALTDLAASSALMQHLCLEIATASRAAGLELSPPVVIVKSGSVSFNLSGGLLVSGVGLIVACSAGLVGAPLTGEIGGLALATAGVIDLAIGWRKAVAEERKLRSEVSQHETQNRLSEIEIKLKELELERARLQSQFSVDYTPDGREYRQRRYRSELRPPPASSDIPRRIVQGEAERRQIPEAFANHLLNRALPTARMLRQRVAGVTIATKQPRDTHGRE